MAITPFDLKQVTYEDDTDCEEIHYNLRGATKLGVLTTLTTVRHLSAAFNDLTHVKGIQQLQFLQHLDISHNRINSLEPISALTALVSLNAGCNKIRSPAPLQQLPSLRVLGLHSNDISRPSAVILLSQLPVLYHLTLAGNPVCDLPDLQQGVVAAMPNLQALDSFEVTQADKIAAQSHALTLQQLAAAEDQNGTRPDLYGDAGSSASAKGTSGRTRQTSFVQPLTQTAGSAGAGHIAQAAASSNGYDSCIKDAAALLPVISVPSLKPSTLIMKTDRQQEHAANSAWSRATPQKEVFKQWYGDGSSRTAAVTVRSDGSAALLWPDGSMAATLDAETGFDGAYRLLAMYRNIVGVAASFDSTGGFVQYPNGGLMLVWNKKDGIGTCYAPDGTVTHNFNSKRKALGLKQSIRQQLDQHYSIVFTAKTYELQLLFDCDNHHLGLSVLHGAQLPQQAAASQGTVTPTPAAAAPPAEHSTQAMLARARAVMAAKFCLTPDGPVPSSPAVTLADAEGIPVVGTTACPSTRAALPAASTQDCTEDDMQALLARARALMAATNAELVSEA